MRYRVEFTSAAARLIKKLPEPARSNVLALAASLATDPRPAGCTKLSGRDAWRVRRGACRVIYEIEDKRLLVPVIRAGHRRDVDDRG